MAGRKCVKFNQGFSFEKAVKVKKEEEEEVEVVVVVHAGQELKI